MDVDKIPPPKEFTPIDGTPPVGIKCIQVVIPSKSDPGSEVMSATTVRQTVCDYVMANPDLAFTQWQKKFTPMYDDAVFSLPVFNQISFFCGEQPALGGSRRKRKRTRRNLKKLRSKRTIRNRYTRYRRRI